MAIAPGSLELKDGHRLHYRKSGGGSKALVCVHGLAQSGLMWASVIERLPKDWTGYALDLLGFGASDQPGGGYSIGFHAGTVAEFIAAIPEQHVVLAANSLGGVVAMTAALDPSDKLFGLVLAGTGPRVRDPAKLMAYRDRLSTMEMSRENLYAMAQGYCFNELPALQLDAIADEIAKASRTAILETMTSSLDTDLTAHLRRISLPTLVVQGLQDQGRPPEDGLTIVRGLQDGRLVVLPRVGHTPMLDAPDEFQELLTSTLRTWALQPRGARAAVSHSAKDDR